MRIFIVTIFLLVICGAAALWYFGPHRSTKAEPIKIYKATPLPPARSTTEKTSITAPAALEPEVDIATETSSEFIETPSESTETLSPDTHTHSHPDMSYEDTDSPAEQDASHHHSDEEAEARSAHIRQTKSEFDAIRKDGDEMLKEGHAMIANQLNQMSIEEQQATLEKMKREFLNARSPVTQAPVFKSHAQGIKYWQDFFNGIIEAGYTPPAGVEE